MTDDQLICLAESTGFAHAAVISTEEIQFNPAFRPYCAENLCGQYEANYACPPVCGTPEEMKQQVLAHRKALVLQSIWEVSDYSDKPLIKKTKSSHNKWGLHVLQEARRAGHSCFLIGASGCSLCSPCAYREGLPCRFPELRYSCLSAYCIYAKALADRCGMAYDCGPGLLSYFGILVFD